MQAAHYQIELDEIHCATQLKERANNLSKSNGR